MASIYIRSGTWWIAYSQGGKLVRKSLKTDKKRIAEREKQALEAILLEPNRRAPQEKNPLVDDFWSQYLSTYATDHKRPGAIRRTTTFWKQLLEFTHAARLGDITPKKLEDFKRWRKKKGNSDQTINNALREIKALFNRAKKMDLYTGLNPVLKVPMYPIAKTMPEFHTEAEILRLLDVAEKKGIVLKRVVLLCAFAGLRKNELANARWEWFDFSNTQKPIIKVKRFPGFDIKDHEDRAIPMSKRIYEEFFPDRQESGFIFDSGKTTQGKSDYRFDPKKSLMSALKEAGLTQADPFQRLRHTFGSLLAQKGTSIYKIARWMGHSSVTVTEKHYAGLQAYDDEIDAI